MCKGCFDSLLYREVVGLVFVTAMLLFAILVWVCCKCYLIGFYIKIGVEGSYYYLMMLKKKKLVHNILIGLSDLLYLLDKLRECAPFVIYGYVKGCFAIVI